MGKPSLGTVCIVLGVLLMLGGGRTVRLQPL